ncbi:hypothetical protein ACFQ3Z_34120 [Streptomyces nogalater]
MRVTTAAKSAILTTTLILAATGTAAALTDEGPARAVAATHHTADVRSSAGAPRAWTSPPPSSRPTTASAWPGAARPRASPPSTYGPSPRPGTASSSTPRSPGRAPRPRPSGSPAVRARQLLAQLGQQPQARSGDTGGQVAAHRARAPVGQRDRI